MAKKTRRQRHSYQFKYAAVMVTEHPNILAVDVAAILGIHPIMLYRWRQEMREGKMVDNDEEARSKIKLAEAEKRIRKLEKELKRVRVENAVLKKAERLFPGRSRSLAVHRRAQGAMLGGRVVAETWSQSDGQPVCVRAHTETECSRN